MDFNDFMDFKYYLAAYKKSVSKMNFLATLDFVGFGVYGFFNGFMDFDDFMEFVDFMGFMDFLVSKMNLILEIFLKISKSF